ncbi:translocation/assembly module TamB [Psychroflexus salis]|uniref:DUF490 domain-containing protein n=1 Tax=Psychroflexus salis TaxID=1526574 RepID=A0A916ZZF3_9FLAO|nr:translocation/assembly module TamB domain-containing protein [Psychroflexus salis]GGE20055.1 DUF490 domain-containing protein [Psychroflexus salis]
MIALLLFLLLVVVVFTIPKVQTYTAKKLTQNINAKYNTTIDVEALQVKLNGDINLRNVFVEDHRQDTLIYMRKFSTSFISLASFWNNSVQLNNTEINGLRFNLVRYKDEDEDNLIQFINRFDTNKPKDSLIANHAFRLSANFILATETHFSFTDYAKENPELFSIQDMVLDAEDFRVNGSDISTRIRKLSGTTGRTFEIEDLRTNFSYTPHQLQLKELHLITDVSSIQADVIMNYEYGDFSDFNNRVQWDAEFRKTDLSTSDLAKLYNEFGYGERIQFNANLKGTLNQFSLENIALKGMINSEIKAEKLYFSNMFDPENDFILEGNFTVLQTQYSDLANLLPRLLGGNLPEELSRFGVFNIKGYTLLNGVNLTSDFTATTAIGNADVKLNFTDLNNKQNVQYQGDLSFDNVLLNKLLLEEKLGSVSFDLKIDGKGFKRKYLDTELQGKIFEIDINKYTYRNINVNGKLKEPEFNGDFKINDPNINMDFTGLINLDNEQNLYNFEAKINYLNLQETNLFTRDSISEIAGNVNINMQGKDINDLTGNIDLNNFIYRNENELLEFSNFKLTSRIEDDIKYIEVDSPDAIEGSLTGIFELTELPEITLNAFRNLYYRKKPVSLEKFAYVDFQFNINSKIVEAIFPQVRFDPGTSLEGSIVANENYFRLNFISPEIEAYNNVFTNINLQIDNKDPLLNTLVNIEKIKTPIYEASDLEIINQTQNDTLFIKANAVGGKNNQDKFQLKLYQTSTDQNELIFGLEKSNFKIKDYQWEIQKEKQQNNRLVIGENFQNIEFDSIVASHKNSFVKLNGIVRDSTYKNVSLDFNEVQLATITPTIDSLALAGIVNGKAYLFQDQGEYQPNIDFNIVDFSVNQTPLGKLALFANGKQGLENFDIKAALTRKNDTLFKTKGEIYKQNKTQFINAKLYTNNLDLSMFSPLGGDVISKMRGRLTGEVAVTNRLNAPNLEGTLLLQKGGLQIPYLNIDYDFLGNTEINVLKNAFIFTEVELKDTNYESTARLDGLIGHNNYSDWELDLNISGANFVALDTEFEDGKLYYGTAFITGYAEIIGPTDDLEINVNATTNKNTLFRIPLDDSEFLTDASFIYFLTEADKQAKAEGKSLEIRDVKGLSLNFDLDITEDAEVEIVVDQESGSTLRGRGTGNLLIEIDTNGKFNMFGDFEAKEGIYDFKYAGLVNKKFSVVPGGTLTWNGDPLQANMNVEAIYRTQANPAMILENPSINRDIPVEVKISLNGELVQPDINFDIDYPNLSSIIKSELDYRIQGRENTEIQAISLVAQGTFYNIEGIGGQGAITGNLVEGASGLIDKLFTDDEGKFKVGLDYTQAQRTPNQNQTGDRVGMSFQTQISDRVLINGRFGVPVGGTTESFVFGDVEINLLLNESGSLRANAFNRESDIQFIGEELAYTQGIGLSYSVDFQSLRDLVKKIINKPVKKQDQTEKESTEKMKNEKSVLPDYIELPSSLN